MKFNCDKVKQRNKKKLEEFWDVHANKWVEEFAWWPVRVAEGDCRWLETVEAMWVPKATPEWIFYHFNHTEYDRGIRACGNWKYRPLGDKTDE